MNSPFDLTEDPQSTGECFFGGTSKWRQRIEHLPGKKLSIARCSGYEKLVTPTLYPRKIIFDMPIMKIFEMPISKIENI